MLPIRVRGARTNNLRDLSLDLDPGQLVAIVGPSGAGKSSLAFGTLYAEGQRRFVESVSAYARQFLERLARPDVEELEPVPAGIAVDRQGEIRTSRSTVGSLTDVADYAKSLWAHMAGIRCTSCGCEVLRTSAESAGNEALAKFSGRRAMVSYAIDVPSEEAYLGVRDELVQDGYRRIRIADAVRDLDEVRPSDLFGESTPKKKAKKVASASFDVIVDRLSVRTEERSRLVEALEAAFKRGNGRAALVDEHGERLQFAEGLACACCGTRYPDPSPGMFSFNSPIGACTDCRGFGRVIGIDWDKVLDTDKPLGDGAILAWRGKATDGERKDLARFAKKALVPMDVPVKKLSAAQRKWLREGDAQGYPNGWWGLEGWFRWLESRTYKMHVRVLLSRFRKYDKCPACEGTRFKQASLAYRVEGLTIADFSALSVRDAHAFVQKLAPRAEGDPAAELLLRELGTRLSTLDDVGLGYLTLDRAGNTLSGGETQRVSLSTALGASLSSAMFVLDEPSVGLHPSDVGRLCRVIRRLADAGNLVIVVEHDPQLIAIADRVIELGPGAGAQGGQLVFDGTPQALLSADTVTGRALARSGSEARVARTSRGTLRLRGARGHNLKNVDLELEKGLFTCVTGLSGSGKSSLILETLVPAVERALGSREARPLPFDGLDGVKGIPGVVHVDQAPLGRTSRGNPATYVGAWDVLRKRFCAEPLAKERGYTAGTFSFNVEGGRCEACKGQGYETVEMQFLADVSFGCPECGGRRFVGPVLDVRHRELDVSEVLQLSVDEVLARFADDREVQKTLVTLRDVGLGYLTLGQPLNTLSGGEAQRLKLAQALSEAKPGSLVVLDEPTAGLHPSDVEPLLSVLGRLLDRGDTVIVVEHDMRIAAAADRVIELGPSAGEAGGAIVASGTAEEVAKAKVTSAPYLKKALAAEPVRIEARVARPIDTSAGVLSVVRAREHNLKGVTLDIPHRQLVALTGPSGSGKSSLAFGVVHAEAQRRFVETLSPYARQYLPQLPRPDVDQVLGVEPSLSLEQRITRGGATSTVATVTEVAHYLRLLYARIGVPVGVATQFAAKQSARDAARSLRQRFGEDARYRVLAAVVEGRKGNYRDLLDKARDAGFSDARIDGKFTKITEGLSLDRFKEHDVHLLTGDVTAEQLEQTLSRAGKRAEGRVRVLVGNEEVELTLIEGSASQTRVLDPRIFSFNTRQGACEACEGRGYLVTSIGRGKKAREERRHCGECGGTRLSKLARSILVHGKAITYYLGKSVSDARRALHDLTLEGREALIGKLLLEELDTRLDFLERVGIGYLGLDRAADTLSGGETQRVRLAAQLGSGLTGVQYVLDEPTIGLHPRDTGLLVRALRDLVERGNSVLVVEHDLDTILEADRVIDMGPGGGRLGGNLVAQGTPSELMRNPQSITGQMLAFRPDRPAARPIDRVSWLKLSGAREHNLQSVDLSIPLSRFTAVTGVSGSGKSTLVREVLLPGVRQALGLANDRAPGAFKRLRGEAALKRAVEVDQAPIGRTPRSVPATYIGIWDELRKLLAGTPEARARGYEPGRFSFNVGEGRCPTCEGNGVLTVEMSFLPDALLPCEDCGGKRFSRETLEVKFHGLSAGDILDLEIERAAELFRAINTLSRPLDMLVELGLGYLKLGQPSSTLSGGEAQRMKLVSELATGAQGPTLYVLDEPTTGLHRSDVQRLLAFLNRFVERGDTVVVIEHHPDVMLGADYLIDLGPEGGDHGGRIVAAGPPLDIAAREDTHTARALRKELAEVKAAE